MIRVPKSLVYYTSTEAAILEVRVDLRHEGQSLITIKPLGKIHKIDLRLVEVFGSTAKLQCSFKKLRA